MVRESAAFRKEYGVPGGMIGVILERYAHVKRQVEKLFILGKCDLIPGRLVLARHMRTRTKFSSNVGLDKLE